MTEHEHTWICDFCECGAYLITPAKKENQMPRFLITAVSTFEYQVPVIAEDEEQALATLNDWIASDFKDYQTDAVWDFEVEEDEQH